MTAALAVAALYVACHATPPGVPCEEVVALAWEESRWTPTAVSPSGECCGVLQVAAKYTRPRLTCAQLQDTMTGAVAGVEAVRWWRARAVRAGKPGCWRDGYTAGNEGFARCRRERP